MYVVPIHLSADAEIKVFCKGQLGSEIDKT